MNNQDRTSIAEDLQENPVIVILEDDLVFLYCLVSIVKRHFCCEIHEFSYARDARNFILENGNKIRLVITDLEMTGMNGFDLIRAIRGQKGLDSIKILVISSYRRSGVIRMELEKIDGYLEKPIDPAILKEAVEEMLM